MKKFSIIMILCLVFAFMLAGCGKSEDKKEEDKEKTTQSPSKEDSGEKTEPTKGEEKDVTETPAPTASPEPEVTDAPDVTEEPTATEEPTVTEEPVATPEPTVTETPVLSPIDLAAEEEAKQYDIPGVLGIGLSRIKNKIENNESITIVDVEYDRIFLPEDVAAAYPAFAATAELINKENAELSNKAFEEFRTYAEDPDSSSVYFNYFKGDILRADEYVVSVWYNNSNYSGGLRPFTAYAGASFDPVTGQKLKISDICNDIDSLGTILAYKLAEKYDNWEDEEEIGKLVEDLNAKCKEGTISFTVGNEVVTFYFVPYEITSGELDNMSVSIPLNEQFVAETASGQQMIGLFGKKYRTVPDGFLMTYSLGEEASLVGLNSGNSAIDTISVNFMEIGEYAWKGLRFIVNGDPIFEDPDIIYNEDETYLYLAKSGEKTFLIVNQLYDGEDPYTTVYSIVNGEVNKTTETSLGFEYYRDNFDDGTDSIKLVYRIMKDPLQMKMESRHDVIGTTFETAMYRIAESGEFEKISRYYDFEGDITLTLKTEFMAGMIDPALAFAPDSESMGEFDINVELGVGDAIHLKKTDGERQLFFVTDNNEWGTFNLDQEGLSYNGVPLNEVFDGIAYYD